MYSAFETSRIWTTGIALFFINSCLIILLKLTCYKINFTSFYLSLTAGFLCSGDCFLPLTSVEQALVHILTTVGNTEDLACTLLPRLDKTNGTWADSLSRNQVSVYLMVLRGCTIIGKNIVRNTVFNTEDLGSVSRRTTVYMSFSIRMNLSAFRISWPIKTMTR